MGCLRLASHTSQQVCGIAWECNLPLRSLSLIVYNKDFALGPD
jgi:hypothetical protein